MDEQANAELLRRIDELEEENIALRAGAERAGATGAHGGVTQKLVQPRAGAKDTAARPHKRSGWWTVLAVVLITVGALIAPFAVVASWARVALTDTDQFVATYTPLAEDPDVQQYVTDEAMAAINEQINLPQITSDVIDGITQLGTGPAATQALQTLKGPAANGLQSLVENGVTRFVQSEAFEDVWATALRVSHTQLINVLSDNPDSAVTVDAQGTIGIQLGPVIDAVKKALVDQGIDLANQIPSIDRTIEVAQVDALPATQLAYSSILTVGAWLPWIAIVILAAGVLVARRRSRALIWSAVALALAMLLTLAALAVGNVASLSAVSSDIIPPDVTALLYEKVVANMRATAVSVLVLALAIAVVGWLAGPFEVPRTLRGYVRAGAGSAREAAERRNISTGRTGEWIYRWRTPLRVAVALIASAVVLLSRPVTVALTLWTLVLSALALLVLEFVQRPTAVVTVADLAQEPDGVANQQDSTQKDADKIDGRALPT